MFLLGVTTMQCYLNETLDQVNFKLGNLGFNYWVK
jgi:hypothetical protein